jgi:hypothetical protein
MPRIRAVRGSEPRSDDSGHLEGAGSQWCNRLYRVSISFEAKGEERGMCGRYARYGSYLTYISERTLG